MLRWEPAEDLSTPDWLATSLLHDIRNPLGTLCAGTEILMDLDAASPQVKRLATNMHRAAERIRDLLADLGRVSRGLKFPSEVCDLRAVISAGAEAAAASALNQRAQILISVDDLQLPLVRTRMERVFANLISNALEAMVQGGTIRIDARKAGECVRIEVEDTGPGIHPGIHARLFEPFVTAGKENGLGLGLALSRQTILDHGGEIWTRPSSGACFVISLPL
jgi:signal transduction histidine kinase